MLSLSSRVRTVLPLWSRICVRLVHVGARRRNPLTFNKYLVRHRPNQLNCKCCVNGFYKGIRGSILPGVRGD